MSTKDENSTSGSMTQNCLLPECLPVCKKSGHGQMILRPIKGQTHEQKFCGTWYDCSHHDCFNSVLYESKQCSEFLAAQRANFR